MELVLFIGLPATGKSSFYKERFYRTHLRVNLDMLRTRRREQLIVDACLAGETRFVVDNTNLTRADRARYLPPARAAGFSVAGYFFESRSAEAVARNALRSEDERIPEAGIRGASGRLELPHFDEGFDVLHFVKLLPGGGFDVSPWREE